MVQHGVDSVAGNCSQIGKALYDPYVVWRQGKRIQLFRYDVIGDANRWNMHKSINEVRFYDAMPCSNA